MIRRLSRAMFVGGVACATWVFLTWKNPGDLSILQPHDGTALTLITCYPFSYLGDAPQRFVVQAVRAEEDLAS